MRKQIRFYTKHDEFKKYLPKRQTSGSAGYDLITPRRVTLTKESDKFVIDSGIYIELPEGYYADMRIRSSLGIKRNIRLSNSTGVIDSDFTSSIKIPLHYFGNSSETLEPGDRVAQIIILKHEYTTEENTLLKRIKRFFGISKGPKRNGGIGSTGK